MAKIIKIVSALSLLLVLVFLQYKNVYNADTNSSDIYMGTAWALNNQGDFATANHVLGTKKHFFIAYHNKLYPVSVVFRDFHNDFAVVHADGINVIPIPIEVINEIAERSAALGFPVPDVKGWDLKLTSGYSYAYSSEIIVNLIICPGNSGGPILNGQGKVRGIIQRGFLAYAVDNNTCTSVGDGLSSTTIIQLLNDHNITYSTANTDFDTWNNLKNKYIDSILVIYAE